MTDRTNGLITVFGYGPTGEATVDRLRARGQASASSSASARPTFPPASSS